MSQREEDEHHQEDVRKLEVLKQEKSLISSEEFDASQTVRVEPRQIRPEPREMKSVQREPEMVEAEEATHDVARLKRGSHPGKERIKPKKVTFEKLEDRPDEAENQENQWGIAETEVSSRGNTRVLLIGGGIVFVLVVALVGLRLFFGGEIAKAEVVHGTPHIKRVKAPFENGPEKWFRDRSGIVSTQALVVLKGYMAAENNQARSQWVRNPGRYLKLVDDWPVPIAPLLSANDPQAWDIAHTKETAYLILTARDHDFLPFRAYFTREGDVLKLDWAATTAWCDVSLELLRKAGRKRGRAITAIQKKVGVVAASELSPQSKSDLPEAVYNDSVLVRCLIRKKEEHYAGVYNDEEYSSFMLLSADKMHNMWGYAVKGSDLDIKLRRLLRYGYFVEDLKKDLSVTVRVRVNEKEALPSQVELMKLEYPEWVTP